MVNQPLRLKFGLVDTSPTGRLTTPASQSLGHPSFRRRGVFVVVTCPLAKTQRKFERRTQMPSLQLKSNRAIPL